MKKTELNQLVKEEFQNILRELEIEEPNVAGAENGPDMDDSENNSELEQPTDMDNGDEGEGESEEQSELSTDLTTIAQSAQDMAEAMQGFQGEVEPWVQSHIAAAKELLSHAADYVQNGTGSVETQPEEEPTDEPSGDELDQDEPNDMDKQELAESESPQGFKAKKDTYLKAKKDMIDQEIKGAGAISEYEQYEDESGDVYDDEGNVKRASKFGRGRGTGQLINRNIAGKAFDREAGREDAEFKKLAANKRAQDAGQRAIDNQEPTMERRVSKSQAMQLKELAKAMAGSGNRGKVSEMIKKLEELKK